MSFVSQMPDIQVCVQSSKLAVREALKELLAGLGPLHLDVEEVGTVELVMAEALNNIVEHAYPAGDPAGPIRIACKHATDGLHLTVTDEGRGMPDGRTPLGLAANLDVDFCDMPEGGFGWFLIKDLAKEVTYKRIDPQNRLTLRLAVAMA
ncbi:ATP-binding protein [uncultured Tateyamaria sp.]|uniref:ATP-binding protein n=1 Tax=uncultured Tateyamaria sp. TaxID=455651 RepID=UPI00262ED856|nr:ATP-binding protein [uncultured Tateyamaria sp.]